MSVHSAVKAALEQARLAKVVGSSLQSAVTISTSSPRVQEALQRYAADLEGIFVVSSVDVTSEQSSSVEGAEWAYTQEFEVEGTGNGVATVVPPKHHKCPRCWRYLSQAEEELCQRCEDVVGDA